MDRPSIESLDNGVVRRVTLLRIACVVLCIPLTFSACNESGTAPSLGTYAYPNLPSSGQCRGGSQGGPSGVINGEVSSDGLRYHVRTPSNYDPTFAHPLLMVYAAAGQSGLASETITGLTPVGTAAGFLVVYADHQSLSLSTIEQLAGIPASVANTWCIDERKVYLTGHSDGGTVALAMAVLAGTKHMPAAIAPSAAGWTGKDLETYQCRDPLPVMIMHSANDNLFRGWGVQTVAWWAACNRCDVAKTKNVEGGCLAYQQCAAGGATLYCEGTGHHRDWPKLNRMMLEFFLHPETLL